MRFYIISWGFFTNKNDVLTTNMWVSTANMWIQSTQGPQRQHEIWVGLVYLCMSTLSYPIMLGTSIWTQPLTTGRFTPESSQSTKWRLCLPPLLDGCRAEKPSQRRSCWIWRTNSEKRAERDCTKEPWKQSRFGDCFMIVGSDIRYGPFSGSTSKSQEEWCFSLFLIGSFNLSIQEWIGDFGSFQTTSSRIQIILRAEHQAQKLVDVFNMVQSTTQYVRCSNDLDPSFTSKSIRSAAVLHWHWNSLRREVSCAWTKLVHGLISTNVLMCYRVIISCFDILHFNRISYDSSSPSPWQDDFGSYLHVVGKRGEPGRAGQFVIEECSLDSVDPFNMHPRCCEQPYLRLVSAIFLSNTSWNLKHLETS